MFFIRYAAIVKIVISDETVDDSVIKTDDALLSSNMGNLRPQKKWSDIRDLVEDGMEKKMGELSDVMAPIVVDVRKQIDGWSGMKDELEKKVERQPNIKDHMEQEIGKKADEWSDIKDHMEQEIGKKADEWSDIKDHMEQEIGKKADEWSDIKDRMEDVKWSDIKEHIEDEVEKKVDGLSDVLDDLEDWADDIENDIQEKMVDWADGKKVDIDEVIADWTDDMAEGWSNIKDMIPAADRDYIKNKIATIDWDELMKELTETMSVKEKFNKAKGKISALEWKWPSKSGGKVCEDIYKPVCHNEVTYQNVCEMEKQEGIALRGSYKKGECDGDCVTGQVCYIPSSQTYDNICSLRSAIPDIDEIEYKSGPCESADKQCTRIYEPVCYKETNATYDNLCLLRLDHPESLDVDYVIGECQGVPCKPLFAPVCYVPTNATYSSVCMLRNSFPDVDVSMYVWGPCEESLGPTNPPIIVRDLEQDVAIEDIEHCELGSVCHISSMVTYKSFCELVDDIGYVEDHMYARSACNMMKKCTKEFAPVCHLPSVYTFNSRCEMMNIYPDVASTDYVDDICPEMKEGCSKKYDPVCHLAKDNTYINECTMKATIGEIARNMWSPVACSNVEQCPYLYKPYCYIPSKEQYKNMCELRNRYPKVHQSDVFEGLCNNTECSDDNDPVCHVSTWKTYINECYLEKEVPGIMRHEYSPQACDKIGLCPEYFEPVCHKSNKMYSNDCEMRIYFPDASSDDYSLGPCFMQDTGIDSLDLDCASVDRSDICHLPLKTTYASVCEMKRDLGDVPRRMWAPVACEKVPICSYMYSPVCHLETNENYSNICNLKVRFPTIGEEEFHDGVCSGSLCNDPSPVCHILTRTTYKSICELKVEYSNVNRVEYSPLPCDQIRVCSTDHDPVCHSYSNSEYSNECEMRAIFPYASDDDFYMGHCESMIRSRSLEVAPCMTDYDPYCILENMTTYGNMCVLMNNRPQIGTHDTIVKGVCQYSRHFVCPKAEELVCNTQTMKAYKNICHLKTIYPSIADTDYIEGECPKKDGLGSRCKNTESDPICHMSDNVTLPNMCRLEEDYPDYEAQDIVKGACNDNITLKERNLDLIVPYIEDGEIHMDLVPFSLGDGSNRWDASTEIWADGGIEVRSKGMPIYDVLGNEVQRGYTQRGYTQDRVVGGDDDDVVFNDQDYDELYSNEHDYYYDNTYDDGEYKNGKIYDLMYSDEDEGYYDYSKNTNRFVNKEHNMRGHYNESIALPITYDDAEDNNGKIYDLMYSDEDEGYYDNTHDYSKNTNRFVNVEHNMRGRYNGSIALPVPIDEDHFMSSGLEWFLKNF